MKKSQTKNITYLPYKYFKNFFHHHGPLHPQVPFSEQEPFYLSEFQPQSSRPLDAAQSNSLENGKHDIKMYIDKLHVQL